MYLVRIVDSAAVKRVALRIISIEDDTSPAAQRDDDKHTRDVE